MAQQRKAGKARSFQNRNCGAMQRGRWCDKLRIRTLHRLQRTPPQAGAEGGAQVDPPPRLVWLRAGRRQEAHCRHRLQRQRRPMDASRVSQCHCTVYIQQVRCLVRVEEGRWRKWRGVVHAQAPLGGHSQAAHRAHKPRETGNRGSGSGREGERVREKTKRDTERERTGRSAYLVGRRVRTTLSNISLF